MMNNLLCDTITRIRNGYMARLLKIKVRNSKLVRNVLQVLQNEGFIHSFFEISVSNDKHKTSNVCKELEITLRYCDKNGEKIPALHAIKAISKPGCRIYIKSNEMKYMLNRFGARILSTNRGILADSDAKTLGIGGECLLEVS